MKRTIFGVATALALAASAPCAHAQSFINVLTGGTSGVYYPLGVAIGKIYGDKIPNVKTQVQATKASVENLILLQQGRGELAFTLGDSLKAAWEGEEPDWQGWGAPMWWSHHDRETNLDLLRRAGFELVAQRLRTGAETWLWVLASASNA